jgi:hypothetical protein
VDNRTLVRERVLLHLLAGFLHDGYFRLGEGHYALCRSESRVDGLITQLFVELEEKLPPSQSKEFELELKEAGLKRVAFTSFVTDALIPHTDGAKMWIGAISSKAAPI